MQVSYSAGNGDEILRRTMEKAAILANRLASETNRGLRRIKRRGITGYAAYLCSTRMNRAPHTTLADNNPQTTGCDQGSSSVLFKLNPRSRLPTVPTSVRDPKRSILRSLSRNDLFSTSAGSRMLTLSATRVIENRRIGAWELQNYDLSIRRLLWSGRRCPGTVPVTGTHSAWEKIRPLVSAQYQCTTREWVDELVAAQLTILEHH